MTQLISLSDKSSVIDLIEAIINRHCWVDLNPTQRAALGDYFKWMRSNNLTLRNNTKVEITPSPQILRITLEYSFDPIPPWEAKKNLSS